MSATIAPNISTHDSTPTLRVQCATCGRMFAYATGFHSQQNVGVFYCPKHATNSEGMTWEEWRNACGGFYSSREEATTELQRMKQPFCSGEDPTDWRKAENNARLSVALGRMVR